MAGRYRGVYDNCLLLYLYGCWRVGWGLLDHYISAFYSNGGLNSLCHYYLLQSGLIIAQLFWEIYLRIPILICWKNYLYIISYLPAAFTLVTIGCDTYLYLIQVLLYVGILCNFFCGATTFSSLLAHLNYRQNVREVGVMQRRW